MYQYDEIGERGGHHAGQRAPGYPEHSAPGYRLGLVNEIQDLLNILLFILSCVPPPQSTEPNILKASVERVNFEIEHFETNKERQ